jgi:protein phosphatase
MAQTRTRILDTAARLFREHGVDGVGIDAIMEAAGLTRGGFYGHFDSKEDLFEEVLRRKADFVVRLRARKRETETLREIEDLPERELRKQLDTIPPPMRRSLRVMESAVQAATYMVFGLGQANPERRGMGTTMSALVLRGEFAITAQVGDSRIYLLRDGRVDQVTEDHTLVAWQIKKGLITEEEARHSKQKNVITRAVGSREYVQVDTRSLSLRQGDRFLLCSDGLHGYVDRDELGALLEGSVEEAAERAVRLANQRGGRDNITAVIVDVLD